MKYCDHCGSQIKDEAVFCPKCGKRQGAAPAQAAPPAGKKQKPRTSIYIAAGIVLVAALAAAAMIVVVVMKGGKTEDGSADSDVLAEQSVPDERGADSDAEGGEADEVLPSVQETTAPEETKLTLVSGGIDLSSYKKAGIKDAAETSKLENNSDGSSNDAWQAFDGQDKSCWQEGVSGAGIGESISVVLDKEYEVSYLTFKLGNWYTNEFHEESYYYWANTRPKTLTITVGNVSQQVEFPVEKKEFTVEVKPAVTTDFLKFRIDDVDRANIQWEDTGITEIGIYGAGDGLGWQQKNGKWYFYEEKDKTKTGWLDWQGKKYYLQEDGSMKTGFWQITAEKTHFDGVRVENEYHYKGKGYYFLEDGSLYTGDVLVWHEAYSNDIAELQKFAQERGVPCVADVGMADDEMHCVKSTMAEVYYVFFEDGTYDVRYVRSE